ncbi:MAG TPA: EFR1 family ferrodoxin [Saprospiraceae bacterium]|nr:EFR1 family ferrodoxin [Saprospiraceae bacterium]
MEIKGVQIYYFSGTGNSRNVAKWFSQVAAEKNIDCQLTNISRIDRIQIEKPKPGNLIVFTSPIHGFNYPPIMLHFIMRFPKGNNPVVLMNTRAGMLVGQWITPGITGIAFYITSLFLMLKGYTIRAFYPVDLPSNWISVHPGLNQRTIKFMHEKIKEKVRKFSLKILSGKTHFKALLEIHDLILFPIAVMYYFAGRFLFSKTYYASADCDHCDVCIKSCPVKAIIKIDNRPYWTFNCESCMKCMSHCPGKAIETGHGFIVAYSILFSMVLSDLFFHFFELTFFNIEHSFLHFLAESALFLVILALWYRLIHFLLRFRIFERLMVYTSLTRFKFWGRRYKALKE